MVVRQGALLRAARLYCGRSPGCTSSWTCACGHVAAVSPSSHGGLRTRGPTPRLTPRPLRGVGTGSPDLDCVLWSGASPFARVPPSHFARVRPPTGCRLLTVRDPEVPLTWAVLMRTHVPELHEYGAAPVLDLDCLRIVERRSCATHTDTTLEHRTYSLPSLPSPAAHRGLVPSFPRVGSSGGAFTCGPGATRITLRKDAQNDVLQADGPRSWLRGHEAMLTLEVFQCAVLRLTLRALRALRA